MFPTNQSRDVDDCPNLKDHLKYQLADILPFLLHNALKAEEHDVKYQIDQENRIYGNSKDHPHSVKSFKIIVFHY